ncbi:tetratricopeptide repeat protein [Salibaculum halophilum]|uniref:tetratricopeptide repeat protein n=1 Tax=Salibaculum halophilum TaxID=1914408 RepID=UPI000A11BF85|nr:tetratricopeptide repeat protein [Salibaculum halophilum]
MPKPLSLALIAAIALSGQVAASPDLGAYLAARQAGLTQDYDAAATYFGKALTRDPGNTALRENTLTAQIAVGHVEDALPVARAMLADGQNGQMANMVLLAEAARAEDWTRIFDILDAGHDVGPMIDGLTRAWALVGTGRMDAALAAFDETVDAPGLRSFGYLHKAVALAQAGDLEGADAILSRPPAQGVAPTRASVLTHVRVLCRLGRFERAQEVLDDGFGRTAAPDLRAIREKVAAGMVPTRAGLADTPRGAVAHLYLSLAEALQGGEADPSYLLMYAQAAAHIDPKLARAHVTAARLLDEIGQHDLAAAAFARVDPADPAFLTAELGRAEALRAQGRTEAAIEALSQLARRHGDVALVHASLGDIHREAGDYAAANSAYDTALSLYAPDHPSRWWVTYARGITHERLDQWDSAEADFRAALRLEPGQPSVLNYLGYSMVEMGENLDEALAMIEQAAAARPESGAIIDSLGWVLFKLGRYDEAVTHMERAVELVPVDPIVTDHLGDTYWMVGRTVEARFQWRRALSFDPAPDLAERIRRKLEVGLDEVMREEGRTPADMAYDAD